MADWVFTHSASYTPCNRSNPRTDWAPHGLDSLPYSASWMPVSVAALPPEAQPHLSSAHPWGSFSITLHVIASPLRAPCKLHNPKRKQMSLVMSPLQSYCRATTESQLSPNLLPTHPGLMGNHRVGTQCLLWTKIRFWWFICKYIIVLYSETLFPSLSCLAAYKRLSITSHNLCSN